MKTYIVKTQFVFTGEFFVEAESKEDATKYVLDGAGLVTGGNIHTNDNRIIDWEFDVHPDTKILGLKVKK